MAEQPESKGPEPKDPEPVQRLPRGRGWGFSGGELIRIAMVATLLVAVLVLRKPCSENVGSFIQSFEPPIDAGPAPLPPATALEPPLPGGDYVRCGVDESPEACVDKIRKARERAEDAGVEGKGATAPGGSDRASAPGSPPAAPDRSPR